MFPLLKWAYEYDHTYYSNYKPVKFIDMCNNYYNKDEYYDKEYKNKEKYIDKNEFIGIKCDCIETGEPTDCCHSAMMMDSYSNAMVKNIIE